MIDLTDDLTALVTRATEALLRGEVVKIGCRVEVRAHGATIVAYREHDTVAWWHGPEAPARVLREALIEVLRAGEP
jgi:Arc/MetJ family transcription regulator